MLLFYTPDIATDTLILPEEEANHCLKVLRLPVGAVLYLTDGKGILYTARIVKISGKSIETVIIRKEEKYGARNYFLHLAVAPTKNMDRYEQCIEKATEAGVDEITPLICARSERRVVKPERLEKVMAAAMKQSLKAYLPKLNAPSDFTAFITQPFDGEKYIAFCRTDMPRELFWQVLPANRRALVVIGPEGDFSNEEISQALQHGFRAVSLGESRLRTETAGIMACFAMYMNYGR